MLRSSSRRIARIAGQIKARNFYVKGKPMTKSKLHAAFLQIKKKRRALTPEIVVEEAAANRHPLHDQFEWDDRLAAHKHRLDQAARLIRYVKIRVVLPSGPYNVRQWYAVSAAGVPSAPAGYVSGVEMLAKPLYREAMLRQMERDWRSLAGRYEHYKEFWDMIGREAKKRRPRRAG